MANSLGDTTAKNMGRITLNPLKHLDFFGSIVLPFLTGFGYAKPVPYNPANLPNPRSGSVKIALAGPLSNVALAILFGLTLRFLGGYMGSPLLVGLFEYIVFVNILLAVFNIFPIPPLDGHWLLMVFLPDRYYKLKQLLYKYSIVFVIFFVFVIFRLISPVIIPISRFIIGY